MRASGSTVVTGPVTDAIDLTKVQVLYQNPSCNFEPVASIKIPGGYFSRASLIDAFRQQAATLGAPMVQLLAAHEHAYST